MKQGVMKQGVMKQGVMKQGVMKQGVMKRLELLCPLAEKTYWIDWLLSHHQGTFEVMPVERYGLPNSLLNRKESVQGFAQWVMLTVVSEKIVCDQLMALLGAESYDRMEVRAYTLT